MRGNIGGENLLLGAITKDASVFHESKLIGLSLSSLSLSLSLSPCLSLCNLKDRQWKVTDKENKIKLYLQPKEKSFQRFPRNVYQEFVSLLTQKSPSVSV
jgi:hypothetical protein